MEKSQTGEPKRERGRPFKKPDLLIDFRISVSFPRDREQELRDRAHRQGLTLSAFMRQAVLGYMDDMKKAG